MKKACACGSRAGARMRDDVEIEDTVREPTAGGAQLGPLLGQYDEVR